ncbi:MAG: hypothetical protein HY403_04550 [Elusimicrobia bacterium]|nr:hypothetical protein [Elusimicrobiota bacterium]
MSPCLALLALALASPSFSGTAAAPRLSGSLGGLGALPALGAASPSAAPFPALTAPSAALAAPAPLLSLLSVPAAEESGPKPLAAASAEAQALFDGGRASEPGADWTLGVFEGDGGAAVHYKSRAGAGGAPARVYAGGLALTASFESLFARAQKPAGDELFLWTRGHAPSAWSATKNPIDADARDLAKAVALAARASPGGKVELVLHSFAALVFQRMLQLHAEPAVAAALKALAGSRVFLLHATTHYEGIDRRLGPEFERIVQATRAAVDFLDAGDAAAGLWEAAARMNPFSEPAASAWLGQWRFQRGQFLELASREAVALLREHLAEPWDKPVDRVRRALLKDLEADARDPGWQEALLRRSGDAFRFEFSPKDAARIRRLGLRLELVYSDADQLLSWESARAFLERLGIASPAEAPPAGSALRDKTGRLRARVVAGDHYFPLKRRDALAEILEP